MFKKILLATDGSDNSLQAARQVIDMVRAQPAEVTILCAAYVPAKYRDDLGEGIMQSFLEDAREAIHYTKEIFDQEKIACSKKLIRDKHPAEAILDEALAGQYDLIVLGTRGLSKREAKRLGSVSHEVANEARCSVLLVR
jgi:nucleotide-binding universal stress UspA family protein